MILRKENKLYYGYGSSQNKILEQPLLCGVGRGSILGNGGLQPSRVDSFVPCSRRIIAISLMPSPVKPTIIICSLGSEFQINNNHYRMRYIHPDQTKKINYVLFFSPNPSRPSQRGWNRATLINHRISPFLIVCSRKTTTVHGHPVIDSVRPFYGKILILKRYNKYLKAVAHNRSRIAYGARVQTVLICAFVVHGYELLNLLKLPPPPREQPIRVERVQQSVTALCQTPCCVYRNGSGIRRDRQRGARTAIRTPGAHV